MSKCSLAVTVDGWEAMGDVAPTFETTSPITGTVDVWVDAPCRCDGLDVELVPVRTTQGYHLGLSLPKVRVFEGTWEPGEYSYRFSVPSMWLPTYEGRQLGWKWVARATADIPWALDPNGEAEFRAVLGRPVASVDVSLPSDSPLTGSGEPPPTNMLVTLMTGLVILSALLIPVGAVGFLFDGDVGEAMKTIGGAGIVLTLMHLVLLGLVSPKRKVSSLVERLEVHAGPAPAAYRSSDPKGLHCEVQTAATVTSVRVELTVREYAEWTTTRNDHRTTHRLEHQYFESEAELGSQDGGSIWHGTVPMPELDDVPCFSIGKPPGHGVLWQLDVLAGEGGQETPQLTRCHLEVRPVMS